VINPSALFLLQAFVIVALPVVLLRVTGLRGVTPLVVVQIFVGVALGPSVFGRLAPSYLQMFVGPTTLTPLTGLAILAVLIFGLIYRTPRRPRRLQPQRSKILDIGRGKCPCPVRAMEGFRAHGR
jgi:hypothetical protein